MSTGSTPAGSVPHAAVQDGRLVPAALGAWAGTAGGLVLAVRTPVPRTAVVLAAVVLGVGAAVVAWSTARPRRRVTGVAVSACCAGLLVSIVRVAPLLPDGVAVMAARGDVVRIEAAVDSDPVPVVGRVSGIRRGPDGVRLRVVVTRVTRRPVDLELATPATLTCDAGGSGWLPGTRVGLRAVVRDGDLLRGTALRLWCRGPVTVLAPAPPLQQVAGGLRAGLVRAAEGWPSDGAGLLPGLVLGDTRATSPAVVADMRIAGLTHLVAVSGSNVAVLLTCALAGAAALGIRRRWRAVVAAVALGGFVVLVRPEPSVVRAAAMGSVLVLAMVVGGRRRGPPALAAAVLALVLLDPWLSLSYGFALSTAATGALIWWAPRWRTWLRPRARWLPVRVVDALVVTAAAQVATAPLLASLGAGIGIAAVPANLAAAPAVAPATVLGVVATAVAPLSPGAAHLVAAPAVLAASWVGLVAHVSAAAPVTALPWPSGAMGGVALAVLIGVVVAVLLARTAGSTAGAHPTGHDGRDRLGSWLRRASPRLRVVVAIVVAAAAVLVPRVRTTGWPPPGWLAVVCDVGQGDAVVLAAGEATAVLVDAGPDPAAVGRCLSDLGVARLPAILLTHFHADHVAGLPGALAGRSVGTVLTSPLPEPAAEAARVRDLLVRAGVPESVATAGEVRTAGDVTWRVLWPWRILRHEGSDPNNASLVLLAEVRGRRMLLGADIEVAAQQAMMAADPDPAVALVKVPHHGSRKQAPGFDRWTGARVAVVSVGAHNDYGHPAPATLAAYAADGIPVWRTDLSGDLAVVPTAEGVAVVPRGAP